jgi:GT2 family glycosyltransferase
MKISKDPLVSIVTVNFNNMAVTADLLISLKKNSYKNLEVIVVDNASKESPREAILKIYPEVIFIQSEENLGFAGGNNLGIKRAKGELIFLVNNDTEIPDGCIEGLVDVFHTHPDAGAVSPKFHFFYTPGIIEYAGRGKVNILTGRNFTIGRDEKDTGQYNEVVETYYAHGGGMMVPRYVIEKAGLLPEEYFLYYEELDWCERIKDQGFKIYCQQKSLILHKESSTTGNESPFRTYYVTRNRILFMRRNVSIFQLCIFVLFYTLFTVPKHTIVLLLSGKRKHWMAFLRGTFWHLRPGSNHIYVPTVTRQI